MRAITHRSILLRDFAAEDYLGLGEEAVRSALYYRNPLNDIHDHINIFRLRKLLPIVVLSGGKRLGDGPKLTKDQIAIGKYLTELEEDKREREYRTLPSMKCQLFHGSPTVSPFIDPSLLVGMFTNMTYEKGKLRADLMLHETPAGVELRDRFHEAKPSVCLARWGSSPIEACGYGFVLDGEGYWKKMR